MTTTATGLLAFSVLNPEGLVARKNVERYERTGKIDRATWRRWARTPRPR